MKTAQYVLMKFVCFLMLLVGLFFLAFGLQQTTDHVQQLVLSACWQHYAGWLGLGLIILSILALMPMLKRHPGNIISVPGIYGDVMIHLESIEAILKRIISKMPEIRRVRVHVTASDDQRRAQIKALVWARKGIETDARGIRDLIESLLHDSVFHILGVEEVASVNLEIMDIIPVAPKKAAHEETPPEPDKGVQPLVPPAEPTRVAAPEQVFTKPDEPLETPATTDPVLPALHEHDPVPPEEPDGDKRLQLLAQIPPKESEGIGEFPHGAPAESIAEHEEPANKPEPSSPNIEPGIEPETPGEKKDE